MLASNAILFPNLDPEARPTTSRPPLGHKLTSITALRCDDVINWLVRGQCGPHSKSISTVPTRRAVGESHDFRRYSAYRLPGMHWGSNESMALIADRWLLPISHYEVNSHPFSHLDRYVHYSSLAIMKRDRRQRTHSLCLTALARNTYQRDLPARVLRQ